MNRVLMWLPRKAGAAIEGHRIVKPSEDGAVIKAAANSDALVGVSGREAVEADETVEIAVVGIADVVAGAAVSRGDLVTSNASGEAEPAADAADRTVGVAMEAAADGDIFPVLLSPGLLK